MRAKSGLFRGTSNTPGFEFKDLSSREIAGIGCVLEPNSNGGFVVASVIEDSPAAASGIQRNDRIIAIAADDEGPLVDVRKMKISQVVEMCRGKKGSKLRVLISPARTGGDREVRKEIVITRNILSVSNENQNKLNIRFSEERDADFEIKEVEVRKPNTTKETRLVAPDHGLPGTNFTDIDLERSIDALPDDTTSSEGLPLPIVDE